MATVTVRLFASLAERLGTRETQLDIGEGLTAGDALRLLLGDDPDAERLTGSVMFAVNREYVAAGHPLRAGDELALIPPVSGGARAV